MRLLLISILMTVSTQSYAAVTDVFDCKLTMTETDGRETLMQSNRVALVRKPEGQKNGMTMTRGEAEVELQTKTTDAILRVVFKLVARHGLLVNGTQNPSGFQSTCSSLSSFVCDQPSCMNSPTRGLGSCIAASPDSQTGSQVPVVNGVPHFDSSELGERTIIVQGNRYHGEARAYCKYVGTYY